MSKPDQQERQDAARFRQSVLEGCQDILEGRTVEYKGSIRDVIRQVKERLIHRVSLVRLSMR